MNVELGICDIKEWEQNSIISMIFTYLHGSLYNRGGSGGRLRGPGPWLKMRWTIISELIET